MRHSLIRNHEASGEMPENKLSEEANKRFRRKKKEEYKENLLAESARKYHSGALTLKVISHA